MAFFVLISGNRANIYWWEHTKVRWGKYILFEKHKEASLHELKQATFLGTWERGNVVDDVAIAIFLFLSADSRPQTADRIDKENSINSEVIINSIS